MKPATEIRVERLQYPNRSFFYRVTVGSMVAGSFSEVDGGYLITHCRKPIASFDAAVRQTVWRRVQDSLKTAAWFSKAMDLPLAGDAVDPQVADTGKPSTRAE